MKHLQLQGKLQWRLDKTVSPPQIIHNRLVDAQMENGLSEKIVQVTIKMDTEQVIFLYS